MRALGFAPLFEAIHVDSIDEDSRKGKDGIFKELLETYNLSPEKCCLWVTTWSQR